MRLTRCHVDLPLRAGQQLALPEAAANHLTRVLRLRQGDACVLFNGDGHDYRARLASVGKREARVDILGCEAVDNESPLHLTLVQGIARGEKMDLILQKATELGVAAFVPVVAERTEVKLDAERVARRMAHWASVIASACEQCGRARVPSLHAAMPLAIALPQLAGDSLRLSLDPQGSTGVGGLQVAHARQVVVAIGPEGGWSPRDRQVLDGFGFSGLRLGPRILRTETAGLAAIAALQSRFGDLQESGAA